MIVIIGHGPSLGRASFDVDQHTVIRLRRAELLIGTRTDIICSSQARYARNGIEFWHLDGELGRFCADYLRLFNPSFGKPSTGLSAAIIARHRYPDQEIGVLGFDYTLHPEMAENWRHDAHAERDCIETLGVIEIV